MRHSVHRLKNSSDHDFRLPIAGCRLKLQLANGLSVRWINRTGKQVPKVQVAYPTLWVIALILAWCFVCSVQAEELKPDVYVPYEDLAPLIEPADKAVLMDRTEFETLLAAAEANAQDSQTIELGQVRRAEYLADVTADTVTLTGTLDVVSLGKGPVAVPLGFAQIGLTRVLLDGDPAPLGYDQNGRLTLIATAKGSHQVKIEGTTKLTELSTGGMQFGVSLPAAVAGNLKLSVPGDVEVHATAPTQSSHYDNQRDRTDAELALGGRRQVTVVLLGNGRRQEDRAILLGESATTVHLTRSHQVLDCLYTVQALRRGVRELRFQLPPEWTITQVACPDLVRWSVDTSEASGALKTLTVRLRSEKTGTTAVHITASAPAGQLEQKDAKWRGPRVMLVGASYQRGYMLLSLDEGLSVRAERLAEARREDVSALASLGSVAGGPGGRLYFHWGKNWSVNLEMAPVELQRSIKERQSIAISPEKVTLRGDFEVTAIGRELFDMAFELPTQWQVKSVQVDNQQTGFEYRVADEAGRRLLHVELSRPVRPEKVARVSIELQNVPSRWNWPSDAAARSISVPLIGSRAQTVSGDVLISASGDLDALPQQAPEALEAVPVGRMVALGVQGSVQYAYSYNRPAEGQIQLEVSRRRPRTSCDAIGLVSVGPHELTGHWRITYTVSRASARRLYLLADKSLGQEIDITSAVVPISSKSIVAPNDITLSLSSEQTRRYDLWLLNLDHNAIGQVVIDVHYERPRTSDSFEVPLVRPVYDEQGSEHLAVQASEELALTTRTSQAKEIDAIDLPPLPVKASRILGAFRLDPGAAISLKTAVHQNYEIPSALATSARLTTYLDMQGGQRTEAEFVIINAGQQFLAIRLPDGAELWSLRVDGQQAKPQSAPSRTGGDYQVALGPLTKPTVVKIVYICQPGESVPEQLSLGGVTLPGVRINKMSWVVFPPPGYSITTQETKMQATSQLGPTPTFVQLYTAVVEHGFFSPVFVAPLGRVRRYSSADRVSSTEVSTIDSTSSSQRRGTILYGGYGGGMGGPGRAAAGGPPPAANVPMPSTPQVAQQAAPKAAGVRLSEQGRRTLPVDLVPTPGAGPKTSFTGFGRGEPVIGLMSRSEQMSRWAFGFVLIAFFGAALARRRARTKVVFIVTVLLITSVLALWLPTAMDFANGAFTAGALLIPLYVLIALMRWSWNSTFVRRAGLLLVIACSAQFTFAATGEILPYEGPPTTAERADKVLIPYARYVELWNQAHLEDTIELQQGDGQVSFADVRYKVTVSQEQLNMSVTALIKTYGKDVAVLGLPFSTLAVTQATLDGQPARLQVGPKGMVLMVPGRSAARLELQAVMKPKSLGRRGSAHFSVPPLPGAVMTVVLPEKDLELEVDQIEATPARRIVDETVEYTFGLGMTRTLALRWLPGVGGGATDRTLTADSQHDVYVFDWAIVGVSKVTYNFPGGEYDRFALVIPKEAMLTQVEGTNIRDFRDIGEKTIEGRVFKLIEIRLHRPAQKQHELTARWISPHPDEIRVPETELALPRAGDVSRESGTVTLHSAGGMSVKVARVTGGRRADMDAHKGPEAVEATANGTKAVARYYWPYRPFSMSVQLTRLAASPQVQLNQLVRIDTDRVELLVQANLKADEGRLFGASFALPQGYEVLSAVGPAVANFYERSDENRKFLRVELNSGQRQTEIALVLVRRDAELGAFDVPMVKYLDSKGRPLLGAKGRLAVQVAASLKAETASEQNLKSISPQTLEGWLDARQSDSVQFAYRYEAPDPSLELTIRQLPTTIRTEVFAGLAVKSTAAMYTYRVRCNITGSPADHLSFRLPSEYAPRVAVESQAMRSVTQADVGSGLTEWNVALVNEVTGVVDIAVNLALPIDSATKSLQVAPLQTDAPAGRHAIVAVQNLSRHEINVAGKTNLSDLPASEQQRLMSRQMRESLQYVFESFDDTWSLNLNFKPAKPATRIQAVVDLLEVTAVVQRSGRCRYEAKVALQNRSEQFLRVRMPEGLHLWSANVASEPVKPVVSANLPRTDVLIPLVKTSPGGLPYDVFLYFADDGNEPLVAPLDGITKLKPPSISIIGVPVTQTTWSLRLPGGYHYVRPGGNMSAVAGTVEMLSLGIDAKLEQLKRLERTYREVAGASVRGKQAAKYNWQLFNKKLASEIGQAERYLDTNRRDVGKKEYERLRTKLGEQRQQQDTLVRRNVLFDQQQQEQTGRDLNTFLNSNASNTGVAETVRNQVLQEKPDFLSKSEEQQIARLEQELAASQEQMKPAEGKKVEAAAKSEADQIIGGPMDKEAQTNRALKELARQSAAQIDQKQAQLREQLEELRDNRSQRHFQADLQKAPSSRPQAERRDQPMDEYEYSMMAPERGQLGGAARYAPQRPQSQMAAPQIDLGIAARTSGRPATPPSAGEPFAGGTVLYVAKGTYSLPVTLPEGEVRLDFTRPAGQAKLSLWAVSQSSLRRLYGTIMIIVALLVVVGLAKAWPRPMTRRRMSPKYVLAYILLLVALTFVLGLIGLAISAIVILFSEAKRGAFLHPETIA
jgi:hypothetical protein